MSIVERRTSVGAESALRILNSDFTGPVERPYGPDAPYAVARAVTAADLAVALRAAVYTGVPLTVRGAGHGQLRTPVGRIVLDTGHLADVQVAPDRRTVTVGPGARWGDVLAAAAPYGLAPLCGNALDVGVTGFTLGGGVGWLSRQYGYTADNVVRADGLLADCTPVALTASGDPDLFWGLRGAGANLALVHRLEIRLAPVATVTAGEIGYPWPCARDVLAAFAAQDPPDHLTAMVVLERADAAAPPTVTVQAVSTAAPAAARRALAAVLPGSRTATRDTVAPVPYAQAATLGGTPPLAFELPDRLGAEEIAVLAGAAERGTREEPARIEVRFWGGAPSRTAGGGPAGHRDAPFSVTAAGPPQTLDAVAGLGTGRSFLNFLRDPDRTAQAYTAADHARLRALKARVDPANLLGAQHNIAPEGPSYG